MTSLHFRDPFKVNKRPTKIKPSIPPQTKNCWLIRFHVYLKLELSILKLLKPHQTRYISLYQPINQFLFSWFSAGLQIARFQGFQKLLRGANGIVEPNAIVVKLLCARWVKYPPRSWTARPWKMVPFLLGRYIFRDELFNFRWVTTQHANICATSQYVVGLVSDSQAQIDLSKKSVIMIELSWKYINGRVLYIFD